MTCVDFSHQGENAPAGQGLVFKYIDRLFDCWEGEGGCVSVGDDAESTASEKSAPAQRLAEIQKAISAFSMYIPDGFGPGLGRQFANMLDEEAWEEEDDLPSLDALSVFLNMLKATNASRRPGIGTNGRGSITAFWRSNGNRLTIDCLDSDDLAWSVSATNDAGEREHVAGDCRPDRLLEVLAPYNPRSWFDQ